jgi:hypothetical protein
MLFCGEMNGLEDRGMSVDVRIVTLIQLYEPSCKVPTLQHAYNKQSDHSITKI